MVRSFARLPIVCLILSAAGLGCDNHLETGYKFRPLNSTDDDRRSYYAQPFTPESHVEHKGDKSADPDQ